MIASLLSERINAAAAEGDGWAATHPRYVPPAGKLGEFVAQLFSDPDKRLDEDLRNFKAYAEGTHSWRAI